MKRLIPTVFALGALVASSFVFAQDQKPRRPQQGGKRDLTRLLNRFDKNKNDVLETSELPKQFANRLKQFDLDKDGKLTREELKKARIRPGSSSRRKGEIVTGPARGERHADKLKVGDQAPDFTLADPKGKREVTLSSFQGKKPVVLIFGSYT